MNIEQKRQLAIAAGYKLCHHDGMINFKNGGVIVGLSPLMGFYALYPGNDEFFDGGDEETQNYLGFFSSEQHMLDEVADEVISRIMSSKDMSDEEWDRLSFDKILVLADELNEYRSSNIAELELTVRFKYMLNGESILTLQDNLNSMIQSALGNGAITGDGPAELMTFESEVKEVANVNGWDSVKH